MSRVAGRYPVGAAGSVSAGAGWIQRPKKRTIEPAAQRTLPAAALAVRALPSRGIFHRHVGNVVGYGFICGAVLAVCAIAYTAYAFSAYRGVVLPGVYVGNVELSGLNQSQAQLAIEGQLNAINGAPVEFVYKKYKWRPIGPELGFTPDLPDTAFDAYSIGRGSDFLQNLIDRLPLGRRFSIGLKYSISASGALEALITKHLVLPLQRPSVNAWVTIPSGTDRAVVEHGSNGLYVNSAVALHELQRSVASLTVHRFAVPVVVSPPYISNAYAASVAAKINRFLKNPPVFVVDNQTVRPSAASLAGLIYLPPRPDGPAPSHSATWGNQGQFGLRTYIYGLIGHFNRSPQLPIFNYNAGDVSVVQSAQNGIRYDGKFAYEKFLASADLLRPGGVIHVGSNVVTPKALLTDPASLDIKMTLGEGSISLAGSSPQRLADVQAIANQLNDVLVAPNSTISFNQDVNGGALGTGWPARVYIDSGRRLSAHGPQLPGPGGAMQEVATTFFRAGYAAGLPVLERHSHLYNLKWYGPPGLDAVVSPSGKDVQFQNSTGGYLLIQARFEPVQERLYIYIYGKDNRAKVTISAPVRSDVTLPGAPELRYDPQLFPGQRRLVAVPYTGGDYTVTRTIQTAAGTTTEKLVTHYLARAAIYYVGTKSPTPSATTTPTATATPTPGPTAEPTPTAIPTLAPASPNGNQ